MRDLLSSYNDQVENIVLLGWDKIRRDSAFPGYYDRDFYEYIADHFLADTYAQSPPGSPQEASQAFLDSSPARLGDSEEARVRFGLCKPGRYCLGYYNLFQPLKPRPK